MDNPNKKPSVAAMLKKMTDEYAGLYENWVGNEPEEVSIVKEARKVIADADKAQDDLLETLKMIKGHCKSHELSQAVRIACIFTLAECAIMDRKYPKAVQ